MQMAGHERALEREMIFLAGRNGVELQNFQPEQIGHVAWITGDGSDVMFVHETGVEGAHERAAVLNVKFEAIRFTAGEQMQRRRKNDFVFWTNLQTDARNPRGCCDYAARYRRAEYARAD